MHIFIVSTDNYTYNIYNLQHFTTQKPLKYLKSKNHKTRIIFKNFIDRNNFTTIILYLSLFTHFDIYVLCFVSFIHLV